MEQLANILHQQIKWEASPKTIESKSQSQYNELLDRITLTVNCISNFDPNRVDEGFSMTRLTSDQHRFEAQLSRNEA